MHKVLIVGCGYVGSAISSIFKKSEKTIVDPKMSSLQIKDVADKKFDVVFVCVDTPLQENFKTLNSILKELNDMLPGSIVCCKSTALPDFYRKAQNKFKNLQIIFYPEYLSHWNHIKDFQNQEFMILGGNKASASKVAAILKPRLKKLKTIKITDIETAALVKYIENSFLASKVTFANEMHFLHKRLKLKSTYSELISLVALDERIGASHWQVPGRDGSHGWGGHCYTKDNSEFARFSRSKLLKYIIKLNKQHRACT